MVDITELMKFEPLKALDADKLRELADSSKLVNVRKGQSVTSAISKQDIAYLLFGEVESASKNSKSETIKAGSKRAVEAILSPDKRIRVTANKNSTILAVDYGLLDFLSSWGNSAGLVVDEIDAVGKSLGVVEVDHQPVGFCRVDSEMDVRIARLCGEIAQHRVTIDRVESLWEPLMLLAARLREILGVPGMSVEQTVPFRDKEIMKQVLDRAGLRTTRHRRCRRRDEIWAAAEHAGFPLIVKPIDGAGSADTHRVDAPEQLDGIIDQVRHLLQKFFVILVIYYL